MPTCPPFGLVPKIDARVALIREGGNLSASIGYFGARAVPEVDAGEEKNWKVYLDLSTATLPGTHSPAGNWISAGVYCERPGN